MPLDLPAAAAMAPPPAMVTAHVLGPDRLRQRGAVLAGEALADWSLLGPAGRSLTISGLPGTLLLLDGVRLTPAPDGRVDLSLLPLAWLDEASLSAGPGGAAHGGGSLAGTMALSLASSDSGNRAWALAGVQAGRGMGGMDVRLGGASGWVSAGYTQGGGLPSAAGLAASTQGRWHLGGRFVTEVGGITASGRALFATRQDGGSSADQHDLALRLAGGTDWAWSIDIATGGHVVSDQPLGRRSSRMALAAIGVSRQTGLVLPWAVDTVALAAGGEVRRLRLGAATAVSREIYGELRLPLLQGRPAAEDLVAELGWRNAWIAGRSETLWKARVRWEFFPGLALRGGLARGIDDLGTQAGIGRSIGLQLAPAFLPGLVATFDWRHQTAGPARVRALDIAVYLRRRVGSTAQFTVEALATRHLQADSTPIPVARLQSVLRVRIEDGGWALMAGWRHRSSLQGEVARHWLDLGVERQLNQRVRLVASVGNAGNAGSAAGPVGRQALLQLVAGF